jgi:gliding motility-associated-like protein
MVSPVVSLTSTFRNLINNTRLMKKILSGSTAKKNMMRYLITAICLFMMNAVQAQYTATWALTSNKTVVVAGAQASGVTAGSMVPGATFSAGSHNTDGFQNSIPSGNWPSTPTDGLHMDYPFSPNGSVDVLLSALTFTARTSGSSGNNMVSLAYQANGTGPWVAFGTPQIIPSGGTNNISFGAINQKFYSGNTYLIRMYMYAQGASTTSSRTVRVKTVVFGGTVISPAGTQPTVTTNTAIKTGKYSGNVTGTLTAGTLAITQSGVVYNTTGTPTIADGKIANGPLTTGAINSNITGLNAGTTYYARAYATSESGNTVYGATLSFITDPPVVPVLTTAAITNILSHKATSGGSITDSGGVSISAKGIVWKAGSNPTLADNKTIDGQWSGSFASLMTGLTPSTNYCVRAYATNSIGTGYGNEICFTTNPPTPIIVTSPLSLNFGGVVVNTNAPVQSYTLTGSYLSPANGTITINAPAGYMISLSAASGFASSLNVPYTGGSLGPITIYVSFSPTVYGAYNGTITHTGGGAIAVNIDNVNLSGSGIQSPGDVSNMGTDFWLGYGFQSLMNAGGSDDNDQEMVLYLSAKQDAVVTVEIPGTGYSQTYNVSANVAIETFPIPKTGVQDARLNSTGVLNRAIHVYSNGVPIALWAHIYADKTSGATMVLPTNTWGSDYSVLTTGGSSNSDWPHSFFFVIASEDNTIVDITPSADITATATGLTTLYPAGVTFSVTLNKGQVFNALGRLIATRNGYDLTGSKVKARDCKEIAVFTGNGRVQLSVGGCSFGDGGSDNFIQQMFPKIAWGSKYLTVPFRDMEAGFLRVVVSDPATIVNVNGTVLPAASLVNGLYYQVNTDTTNLIQSDKPVMVAQFCASHACNGTGLPNYSSTGNYGDPEMIILSPVQQAINDVTVFSATHFDIARNYINVVVKNAGVSSFQLDGVNVSSLFTPHKNDPAYSYAVFTGLTGGVSHRLTSSEPFNAIAYGFTNNADHESYGYNAGTYLKDLSTKIMVQNPYGLNDNATTCVNNPFDIKVALPLLPANIISLTWNFSNNPNLSPNAQVIQNAPVTSSGTVTVDGNVLNIYTLTGPFTFNAAGTYPVKVIANATTADGCVGLREYTFDIIVRDNVLAEFTGNMNVCVGSSVTLNDASNGFGTTINQWNWNMGDGVGTATSQNTTYTYGAAGTFTVTHRAINDIGCFDDVTHTVIVAAPPTAAFTVGATRCVNVPVTFTNNSTIPSGTIVKWTWNFGDPASPANVVVNTGAAQTHTYANPGTYTVTLQVESALGCVSTVSSQTITIYRTIADFTINATPTCINTNVSFTDASTGGGSSLNTWQWNFGAAGTSSLQAPAPVSFTSAGTVNVTLTATSAAGCIGTATKPVTILAPLATPSINCVDSSFDRVTFGWAAVTGATGYQVSVNGGAFTNPSSGATGTTHQVTGLAANTSVAITVRALGTLACQQSSATVNCKTTLPVLEVYIPNTFTPNGDGKNDIFKVYNNYLKSVTMKVFNQWGELIFTSTDPGKGWDGTSKGKLQPTGVYVYVVNVVLLDGTAVNRKGSINLIR